MGSYSKKSRVNIFQLEVPRPNVPPKTCTSPISYTDRSFDIKLFPPFSNVLLKAHPKGIPPHSSILTLF